MQEQAFGAMTTTLSPIASCWHQAINVILVPTSCPYQPVWETGSLRNNIAVHLCKVSQEKCRLAHECHCLPLLSLPSNHAHAATKGDWLCDTAPLSPAGSGGFGSSVFSQETLLCFPQAVWTKIESTYGLRFFPTARRSSGRLPRGASCLHAQPPNITTPSMKQGGCLPLFPYAFINVRRCIQFSLQKRSP